MARLRLSRLSKSNEALRAGFSFCGSTLTVLAEPGTWLVRKARRDFQPEFSAHTSTASLLKTASGPMARNSEIQPQDLWLTTVSYMLR